MCSDSISTTEKLGSKKSNSKSAYSVDLQKCIVDSAQDKPANPISKKSKGHTLSLMMIFQPLQRKPTCHRALPTSILSCRRGVYQSQGINPTYYHNPFRKAHTQNPTTKAFAFKTSYIAATETLLDRERLQSLHWNQMNDPISETLIHLSHLSRDSPHGSTITHPWFRRIPTGAMVQIGQGSTKHTTSAAWFSSHPTTTAHSEKPTSAFQILY